MLTERSSPSCPSAKGEHCSSVWRASICVETNPSGCPRWPSGSPDARKWLKQVGAMLDGIIAKRRDALYESGNRHGMQKIKNYRTVDCVVGGFRYNEGKKTVGSLLLGLYDDRGLLNHVGFTSSLKSEEKKRSRKSLKK